MKDYELLLQVLKNELILSVGCTEPGAVAYAAAVASNLKEGPIDSLLIEVSPSIYKNGAKVYIPGASKRGLAVAAALGAIMACPDKHLALLEDVDEKALEKMEVLLREKKVEVLPVKNEDTVYIKATIKKGNDILISKIEGKHDDVTLLQKNEEIVYSRCCCNKDEMSIFSKMKDVELDTILNFIEHINVEELTFIEESLRINEHIAKEKGVNSSLKLESTFEHSIEKGLMADDLLSYTCKLTAAAVDKRMSGTTCAVMSCGGSGNQGILSSVPLIAVAERKNIDHEILLRALALSFLTTLYYKSYIGKLSVLCGCSIVAGVGATAGLTYMLGGNHDVVKGSINNMISSLSGMVCDGAKEGCTMKILSSVYTAFISALFALDGICISSENGIIGGNAKESIMNLTKLSQEGMAKVDDVIVDILKLKA